MTRYTNGNIANLRHAITMQCCKELSTHPRNLFQVVKLISFGYSCGITINARDVDEGPTHAHIPASVRSDI